jgi:hypothetical protein
MTRRRLLLLAVFTALVVAVVAAALLCQHTSITRENEARIREGMTMAELEAILGGPPRDEISGPTDYDPDAATVRVGRPTPTVVTRIYEWRSDEVLIRVHFDAAGRAEWINTCPLHRVYPGVVATVRHWLRR